MSTVPMPKFAAYSLAVAPVPAMASPLNDAPRAEASTCVIAVVPAAPFHPAIVPFSVANMNRAFAPFESPNEPVLLNTCPVGTPGTAPPGPGMVTTRPCFTPAPLYSVDTPVPASETQNGLVALNEMPHG